MAILVTGVRFDQQHNITHAEWGIVKVQDPFHWVSQPKITRVIDLVNAINRGKLVQSRINVDGHLVLGPEFMIKILPDGWETIEFAHEDEKYAVVDLPAI